MGLEQGVYLEMVIRVKPLVDPVDHSILRVGEHAVNIYPSVFRDTL
jgi:hypothetical protein